MARRCRQITPTALLEMISDSDPKKSASAMQAMMSMKKLDIAALNQVFGNSK